MSTVSIITLKAAHNHLQAEGKATPDGFVNFYEMKALLVANLPKRTTQGWSFIGTKADWKRCVQPYFS